MSQLFDDKPRNYAKPARRAETTYSFLVDPRTLSSQFEICWNGGWNVSPENKKGCCRQHRHRPRSDRNEVQFNGAFFELFLHEFLVGTTGEV